MSMQEKSFLEIYLDQNIGDNVVLFLDYQVSLGFLMGEITSGKDLPPRKTKPNKSMAMVSLEERLKLDIGENLTVVSGISPTNYSILMSSDTKIRLEAGKLIFRVERELLDLWIEPNRVLKVVDTGTEKVLWEDGQIIEINVSEKFNQILDPKKK